MSPQRTRVWMRPGVADSVSWHTTGQARTMNFRKVLALRGPNLWAYFPVLEVWVDLGERKDLASSEMSGFNDRLTAWLPSLIEHRCSVGERGGFIERLRRGTYLAHILEHVTIELQCLAGTEVGYGKARMTGEDGVYKVAIEYEDEDLARACLETARALVLAAVEDQPFDVAGEVAKLRTLAQQVLPDPCTAAVLQAARKRKIPVTRLKADGLWQLGQGTRLRRIRRTVSDRTNALAVHLAGDLETQRELLERAGVPVPAADDSRPANWRLVVIGERLAAAWPIHSSNGIADATELVHPDVASLAIDAVRVIGLDVAAVEIVADEIYKPLESQRGVVVAVRAEPELPPHRLPELQQRLGETLVANLFPPGDHGRIPVIAVTGVNGKTTTTRLAAHILSRAFRCVGMTCTEGIYVGGRRIEAGDCSGPYSARGVLQNPKVDAAVLETARGGLLRAGLGFDRCQVAVVTNIADGDHLGIADIETPEQLALVKRTIVDVVLPEGSAVLKADDPLVAEMAKHCPGSVVFFARDGRHPIVVAHRQKQGRAVFVRDQRIILAEGDKETALVHLERVPLTHGGRVDFEIENALAATAAAWTVGVPHDAIRAGLESFGTSLSNTPGRFNLLAIRGATVILDYGHNVHALSCLFDSLKQLPHRRRTTVFSVAGDRRDDDFVRQGELLGEYFDRILIYEDEDCIRGRQPGEIASLLRQGLAKGRRVREIHEIIGAVHAAEVALDELKPGDLLLLQVDRLDETINLVRRHHAREIDFQEAIRMGEPEPLPLRVPAEAPTAAVTVA